jgi:hypothetical protein
MQKEFAVNVKSFVSRFCHRFSGNPGILGCEISHIDEIQHGSLYIGSLDYSRPTVNSIYLIPLMRCKRIVYDEYLLLVLFYRSVNSFHIKDDESDMCI